MRAEHLKRLGAALSLLSVGTLLISLGFETLGENVAQVSIALAAAGAATSVFVARKLEHAREDNKRIFLIYAREDLEAARHISEFLRERGFRPWLDVDEIAPGEAWKRTIFRALEESAVALVLVSEHLAKKGFVQEELRTALSTLQERRRDTSPVIPVRLGEAPVPEALGNVQWVDFDADGLKRLERGLHRVTTQTG